MTVNKELRATQEIERIYEETRKERMRFLKQCRDIQSITKVLYQHEINRRSRKRGEDDRFVRKFIDVERHKMEAVRGLEVEKELMEIEVPEVKGNEVLVHGRITNENLYGVEGLVVLLEDAEGKPISKFSGKTTGSGYYSIIIDPDTLEKVPEEVYLNVSTTKGKVLHKNPEPLALKKGKEFLVEMPLDSESLVVRDIRKEKPGRGKEKIVKDDLLRIKGIGKRWSEKLKKAGITDIKKFVEADDEKLKEVLNNISIKNIQKMKKNARKIFKNK